MGGSGQTLVCSVLFLDIVEYSKKPVSEQLQAKQEFNALLACALEQVPPRDRVILDTGDGAAVAFLGDPEDALFAAMSLRATARSLPVRIGVNLGPVRLVQDLNDRMNIIGDGINVAQRVMGFAQPGQLLVSRSFYEVVSCLSRDYSKLFRHEGSRTDKHVRAHELYSVLAGVPGRRVAEGTSRREALAPRSWLAASGPLGIRVAALVAAPLVFFAIVGSALLARQWMHEPEAATRTAAVVPVEALPVPASPVQASPVTLAAKPSAPPVPKPSSAPAKTPAKAEMPPAAAPKMARIELAIAPWGEIVINGKSRGASPPLSNIEIAPGAHTIEIRNSTFPSHIARVDVKPGEAVRIRHRFK